MKYFSKMRGTTKSPPAVGVKEVFWSWLGAMLGILLIGCLHYLVLAGVDLILLIPPFGASAVLVFGAPKSPLAQPRNLIGGHAFAALVGVACFKVFPDCLWFAAALAVATSIAVMHVTRTLHPPAGATTLIAVIGGEQIHALGFMYAFIPVTAGALILLLVGLLFNNALQTRRYPQFWF
ncbi:MAG: HPP family protein [Thermodesulfobacteriota bacterium]